MKVFLMHSDRNFDAEVPFPANERELSQDLELDILVSAMSRSDKFSRDIIKKALLQSLDNRDSIRYRQQILEDALANGETIRSLYAIAVEAIETKLKNWFGIYTISPGSVLFSATSLIEMYIPILERLRTLAELSAGHFRSEGFLRFFSMIRAELDSAYFAEMQDHLSRLKFQDGVLISSMLSSGAEASNHVLRMSGEPRPGLLKRIFARRNQSYSFMVNPRDDASCQALEELRNRGLNCAANALAQAADHIDSFFQVLRAELAFYIGCLNLNEQLCLLGEPVCFPEVRDKGMLGNSFQKLYNICLSLHMHKKTVGNDMDAIGRNPVVITGVNEGGKSTFLRSVGIAQLMMQCGMFVPAVSYTADIVSGVFTHFRRREDRTMSSGKFDEELARMATITAQIRPYALILFNESFAATNEREGSDIAEQIIRALAEQGVRIVFVTHLYTLARTLTSPSWAGTRTMSSRKKEITPLFLKAERLSDGSRTFRLEPGDPTPKSFGEDLYRRVFGREET